MAEEYRVSPRDEAIEKIEGYIWKNQLKSNAKLPSERDLCEMWGVSRSTLRAAILRLIDEGRLYNRLGSGTFVAPPKVLRTLQDLRSLEEYTQEYGRVLTSRVISMNLMEGNKKVCQKLHIPLGRRIFELTRVRYFDEVPGSLDFSYIEAERFPRIECFDFARESFYAVLKGEYGIHITGGEEKIGVTYASAAEASHLGMAVESPLFFISGIVWDEQEIPIEYFKSVARPDRVRFASTLR